MFLQVGLAQILETRLSSIKQLFGHCVYDHEYCKSNISIMSYNDTFINSLSVATFSRCSQGNCLCSCCLRRDQDGFDFVSVSPLPFPLPRPDDLNLYDPKRDANGLQTAQIEKSCNYVRASKPEILVRKAI